MAVRSNKPAETVKAFLSCSVRARDERMVKALASALAKHGIECVTIGRNDGKVGQVDDAIVATMRECDCLVGLATVRYEAVDVDDPTRATLKLATSYLAGESAMAHFDGMPWMIFRAGEIAMVASTGRNLYVEIEDALGSTDNIRLKTPKAVVDAMIADLRAKALKRRAAKQKASFWDKLTKALAVAGAAYTAYRVVDVAARPECFGDFYYADSECKVCTYQPDCRAEKARRKAGG